MRETGAVSEPHDVPIRDESIRLGQFLKLANLVESGAEARPLVTEGLVRVNGETETRRGRQLVPGDVVALVDPDAADGPGGGGPAARVVTEDEAPDPDDLPW